MEIIGCLPKGANHDAVDSAKCAQFAFNRTNLFLVCTTVGLVRSSCLGKVLGGELTCYLSTALMASCPSL